MYTSLYFTASATKFYFYRQYICILCLSCNVNKSKTTAKFYCKKNNNGRFNHFQQSTLSCTLLYFISSIVLDLNNQNFFFLKGLIYVISNTKEENSYDPKLIRQKKNICVFTVTCQKKSRVGRSAYFFFLNYRQNR